MSALRPWAAIVSRPIPPVMIVGTVLLLMAQAADFATFTVAMRFIDLRYEINPIARLAYGEAGLFGLLTLKVIFCAYIVWGIAVACSGWGRMAVFAAAIGLGLVGAVLNVWSLTNFWSTH